MALLEWTDSLDVHVSQFNQQHQRLVTLINDLHAAMAQGKGSQVIGGVLKEMGEYTVYHFQAEERLMAAKGYPGLAAHRAEHEAFVAKVKDLTARFEQGSIALSIETLNFLKDWLVHHIQGTDKRYGAFFSQAGVL